MFTAPSKGGLLFALSGANEAVLRRGRAGGGELSYPPTHLLGVFVSAFDVSRLVGTQFLESGISTDSGSGHPRKPS